MEKIQSANSQLFAASAAANQNDCIAMDGGEKRALNVDSTNKLHSNELLQSKHRVTFSSDVEEYEDDLCEDDCGDGIVQYKDDEAIDREVAEITGFDTKSSTLEGDKIDGLMKFMTIEENIYANDDDNGDGCTSDNESELEILEKINYHFEQNECQDPEAKSMSIDQIQSNAYELVKFKNTTNAQKNIKKSEIVLSINGNVSACRPCAKTDTTITTTKQISSYKRPSSTKAIGTDLERYKRETSRSNKRSVSASASASSSNRSINPSNDLFKIHLNVRACCENKYLDNNRLPRYNGYISQYGLSKDQIEQRNVNRQKYMEQRTRRNRAILRAKEEIANLNEQAFRQWLIRKNHVTRSKCNVKHRNDV